MIPEQWQLDRCPEFPSVAIKDRKKVQRAERKHVIGTDFQRLEKQSSIINEKYNFKTIKQNPRSVAHRQSSWKKVLGEHLV